MNGRRAKILRAQARVMTRGRPDRRQEKIALPSRERWVEVPSGDTFLERMRNKFLHAMGVPVPMKRELRSYTPSMVREVRGTTRWVYQRLKRMYYGLRLA